MIEEEFGQSKDLYGIQVDVCARVMSLAEGGQILLTRSAFDNARQVISGRELPHIGALSWLNHGQYLLKGIDEPIEICELGEVAKAPLKAPADSEKVHRYASPDSEPVRGDGPYLGCTNRSARNTLRASPRTHLDVAILARGTPPVFGGLVPPSLGLRAQPAQSLPGRARRSIADRFL